MVARKHYLLTITLIFHAPSTDKYWQVPTFRSCDASTVIAGAKESYCKLQVDMAIIQQSDAVQTLCWSHKYQLSVFGAYWLHI